MKIDSAMQSALSGMQKGLSDMKGNAAKVAGAGSFTSDNPADLAQPLVELQSNRLQIEASAKALKAAADTVGSLIDILA